MSSAIKLQRFLSYTDTGLFFALKTIRRACETLSMDWVITGELAINLYAYMAGLLPMSIPHLEAEFIIQKPAKELWLEFVQLLEQVGFMADMEYSYPVFTHLMCPSVRFHFRSSELGQIFNPHSMVWLRNKLGKLTYPLISPALLERQQLRAISYVSVENKHKNDAVEYLSEPVLPEWIGNIHFHLTLIPQPGDGDVLIAGPINMPSEISAGVELYEWTKNALSELIITDDTQEVSMYSENRLTKNMTYSKSIMMEDQDIHKAYETKEEEPIRQSNVFITQEEVYGEPVKEEQEEPQLVLKEYEPLIVGKKSIMGQIRERLASQRTKTA